VCAAAGAVLLAASVAACVPDRTVAPSSTTTPSPGSASSPPTGTASPSETGAPAESTADVTPAGAQPILTSVAWNAASSEVVASGLVDGTLDAGLECEFEFSLGGDSVTNATTPEAGPSSVDCGSVYVPAAELGAGEWSVVLAYGSTRSAAQKVEVP
jgi:hypothetical protein